MINKMSCINAELLTEIVARTLKKCTGDKLEDVEPIALDCVKKAYKKHISAEGK